MSTLVFTSGVRMNSIATAALKTAARFWFVVAVAGQMIFSFYVAYFYGGTAMQGRLEDWNRFMRHGYVRGDASGNLVMAIHLLSAVILTVGGAIQLIPQIRERAPRFHRWLGRIFMLTAFSTSIAGLYMSWLRFPVRHPEQKLGISLNAVLILIFAFIALRLAMARKISDHRRWALRLFMVVNGTWFLRVGVFFWLILNRGAVGFDPKTFSGPFITFMSYASYLLPLAILELYLLAQSRGGAASRLAVAALLIIAALVIGIGSFAITAAMWLPTIRAV